MVVLDNTPINPMTLWFRHRNGNSSVKGKGKCFVDEALIGEHNKGELKLCSLIRARFNRI